MWRDKSEVVWVMMQMNVAGRRGDKTEKGMNRFY